MASGRGMLLQPLSQGRMERGETARSMSSRTQLAGASLPTRASLPPIPAMRGRTGADMNLSSSEVVTALTRLTAAWRCQLTSASGESYCATRRVRSNYLLVWKSTGCVCSIVSTHKPVSGLSKQTLIHRAPLII